MTFTGTTAPIGGTELFAGGAFTQSVAIAGAAVGMTVEVTPRTFPGNGIYWTGYVSSPGVVTVKVGATIALFVTESVYDVQVNDASTPASGGLQIATVTLSGAQLAALNSTTVTAIAAQGAGKYPNLSMFLGAACQFTAGTTPYSKFGALNLEALMEGTNFAVANAGNFQGLMGSDAVNPNLLATTSSSSGNTAQFDNLAIVFQSTPNSTGRITDSNVSAGNAGLLYAPGDTFLIDGVGDSNAAGIIDTVGAGGDVLTYHFTDQGTGYQRDTEQPTTTNGAGTGFELDINAIQSVADGDGPVTFTIPYIVVTLD